jgi:hypothetical protein
MGEFSIATMEESSSSKVISLLSNNIDDTNIAQRLSLVLLKEFNYLHWSRAVTIAINGRSKLGFINSSISSPNMDYPEYEIWLSKDQLVMSWILNSMERNLAEIFSYSESAHDLWNAIRDMYGNQNNTTQIFQIHREIANLHQDNKSFVQLLENLKSLWNELEIYRPHICDVAVLRRRTEEGRIFQLLASLSFDFEDLRSHILMNLELPSLKSVTATIQREEIHRNVMNHKTHSGTTATVKTMPSNENSNSGMS